MSLLSSFVKQVNLDIVKFQEIKNLEPSESLPVLTQQFSQIKNIFDNSNKNLAESEKIKIKLNYVDPVTGEKRFGKQSEANFYQALDKLTDIFPQIEQTYEIFMGKLSVLQEKVKSEEEKERRSLEILESSSVQLTQEPEIDQEELARKQKEEQILHDKAEAIRLKRQHDLLLLHELESKREQLLEKISMLLDAHSSDNSSKVILLLLKNLEENNDPNIFKEALKFLSNIFDRIVSRPDDINTRKLRITHPIVKEKFTRLSGAIPLLSTLGFKAIFKNQDIQTKDPCDSENPLSIQDQINKIQNQIETLVKIFSSHDYLLLFEFLAPHSSYEFFFEMEEPPIDDLTSLSTTEKKSWIHWFDTLKENLDSLQKYR